MRKEKTRAHKINTDITSVQVRLVGNGEPKILSTIEALQLSRKEGMDLIAISENGDIPVVRMEEYSKFLYNLEKKEKEIKKNSLKTEIKEIKLSCEIADNDLNTKVKKGIEFLKDGDKVKCTIQLKGRQNTMPERGELVMLKFADMVQEVGVPENFPKLEGSKITMLLKQKIKSKK
jgi:translation initiation factor IF-3